MLLDYIYFNVIKKHMQLPLRERRGASGMQHPLPCWDKKIIMEQCFKVQMHKEKNEYAQ
jgi:hypothetical protein